MTATGCSLCPVNQSLHKWNHLILTTAFSPPPLLQFTDSSGMYLLGIYYVPGTVLGPRNPMVNETDGDGARILEMRKLRPRE